jgi:hypothetical protein
MNLRAGRRVSKFKEKTSSRKMEYGNLSPTRKHAKKLFIVGAHHPPRGRLKHSIHDLSNINVLAPDELL